MLSVGNHMMRFMCWSCGILDALCEFAGCSPSYLSYETLIRIVYAYVDRVTIDGITTTLHAHMLQAFNEPNHDLTVTMQCHGKLTY